MSQAYYSNTIKNFLVESDSSIVGKLHLEVTNVRSWTRSTESWYKSINLFKESFKKIVEINPDARLWTILLEYEIPRLLRRIDAVIIANDLLFVIEYKDDREKYQSSDIRQVEDYALDLKDFHLGSRDRTIIPILFTPLSGNELQEIAHNKLNTIQNVLKANSKNFYEIVNKAYTENSKGTNAIDPTLWESSPYTPTPTIIQAAQALFAGHSVESITKSGADKNDLVRTTDYILNVINDAKANNKKVTCFVTGVPGAGKTLVGLNIIHRKEFTEKNDSSASYFSGNGPLIKVLREALIRDEYSRAKYLYTNKKIETKPVKGNYKRTIESKIQNLHSFIKDGIRSDSKPFEKIVIFDEAQRCWDANHFYNQIKRNQNREKEEKRFNPIRKSEPEVLFDTMDKHDDWAVIIALVGSGQEINTGEAGIEEWERILNSRFNHWEVHISPKLLEDDPYFIHKKIFDKPRVKLCQNEGLHLSINQRSFKANNLNEWVNAVLVNNPKAAKNLLDSIIKYYPIGLTRDLSIAKKWLRQQQKGSKRIGLITSSGANRLRSYGINTKEAVDEPLWFLNDEKDVRSSNFLEIAVTEFGIQGLEIDWACLCWDADFRRENNRWVSKNFSGTSWKNVSETNIKEQEFILNTYRVLLTRAREGMIIWVPKGNPSDETALPEFYDPICNYLKSCGVPEIK